MKHTIVEPSNIIPALLSVEGAVRYLGLSRATIYDLMDSGKLVGLSIRNRGEKRGSRRFRVSDLDDFVARMAEESGAPPSPFAKRRRTAAAATK